MQKMNLNSDEQTLVKICRSLDEFRRFITETPYNKVFMNPMKRASNTGSKYFTGTDTFDEAMDLFINGWHTEAKLLNEKLNAITMDSKTRDVMTYDVVGFQASVPRYLQGIPTNMVNKRKVQQKAKVCTIIKNISYSSSTDKKVIEEESTKVLHLVRTMEQKGMKVNLDIVYATKNTQAIIIRVRIKSANERLNISKMAFPLVHPSMLRRLFFRAVEVMPGLKDNEFFPGYGNIPKGRDTLKKMLKPDEIYIDLYM